MQKAKTKKFLAMLLCMANVLGQVTPVAAQGIVADVTEEAEALVGQSESDANDVESMKRENFVLEENLRLDSASVEMEDRLVGYSLLLEGNIYNK